MERHRQGASSLGTRIVLCLVACVALAACQPQTNVAGTANVPAQYAHVWVTLQRVAFNTSATAGPEDSGWQQYTLPSPQTLDLAALTNGTLSQFASSLKVPQGTYSQMRLVLTDSSAALTSAAKAAGAMFNDEVDYTDTSGALHRLPLEVPDAADGAAFAVSFTVVSSQQAGLAALACAESSGSTSEYGTTDLLSGGSNCAYGGQTKADCVSGQFFDSILGSCITVGSTSELGTLGSTTATTSTTCAAGTTYDAATGSCITSTTTDYNSTCSYDETYDSTTGTCSSALTAATTSLAVDFDAARDIVPYTIGGQPGFLLIPHLTGYNLSQAGYIYGTVDVSALPTTTGGIQVTAETLSTDGTHHVIVESAPLSSTGTFVLYPLPATTAASSSTSTTCPSGETYDSATGTCVTTASTSEEYDLVIHGPGIAPVIITGVPVTAGSPTSGSAISFGVTLTPSTSFPVELASGSTVSPPGAYVGFYQTIPASGEVPYLIEAYPVDPFTGAFDTAPYLSAANLQFGAYASGTVALTTAVPSEGAGAYHVAASAPLYGDGPLSTIVTAPASAATVTATTVTSFTVAAIPLPSATTAASVAGTVSVAAPGKYDKGELLLTQNGALVAVTPLDAYLGTAQSNATLFSSVPSGSGGTATSTNQYYAEAWVWSSSNPSATLSRQPVSTVIDLSNGSASGVAVSIQ